MLLCVKKWVHKLPSITGQDAFEVSKYVEIDFWNQIKQDYEGFVKEALESEEVSLALIIGMWGLGKTSSFKAFAKPIIEKLGGKGIAIKARDLFDIYRKLRNDPYLLPERMARSIVITIMRSEDLGINEESSTVELYKQVLDRLKAKTIFVFVDEFESIIGEKAEFSSEVIEGLTALVNGEFKPLSKNGELKGKLHILLSMTPQALARFTSEIEISETLGRSLRRFKKKIELRPLTRREGYELFLGYLKYIYGGELPKELPFPTLSVFDAIYIGGKQNPGYIVAILNNLLSRLISENCPPGYIRMMNIRDLRAALESPIIEELGIFRGCIESQFIESTKLLITGDIESDRIKHIVDSVFEILALSPFPISLNEIKQLQRDISDDDIQLALKLIENKLSTSIRRPLLSFRAVRKEEALEVINKVLVTKELQEIAGDVPRIIDQIVRFRISDEGIVEELVVPDTSDDIMIIARELSEKINVKEEYLLVILDALSKIDGKETLYRLSREILDHIYPPECPICPVTTDKDKAIRIWRDALRAITTGEVTPRELGLALVPLILSDIFFNEEDFVEDFVVRKKWNYGATTVLLRFSALGILSRNLLDKITFSRTFRDILENVPVIILFVKDQLAKYAGKLKEELKKDVYVYVIPIGTIELAVMLGLRNLRDAGLKPFRDEIRKLIERIRQKIKITDNLFSEILEQCQSEGILITKPSWDPAYSLSDIPRVYDYYLVHPKAVISSEEVFKWVQERIKSLLFYGMKARDIPCTIDIESPKKLLSLENYLIRYGFLKESVGRLIVTNSPIEERLLRIIRERKRVPIDVLQNYFILEAREKLDITVLKSIYLSTLERKGYIKEVDKKQAVYEYVPLEKLEQEAEREVNFLVNKYNGRDELWRKLAHIVVTKERGYRFIRIRDFISLLEELLKRSYAMENELDKRRLLKTILRLLKGVLNRYFDILDELSKEIERVKREIEDKRISIKQDVNKLIRSLFTLGFMVSERNIREIIEFEGRIAEINKILEMELSNDDVKRLMSEIRKSPDTFDIFDFSKLRSKTLERGEILKNAYYYNLKYYLIKKVQQDIENIHSDIKAALTVVEGISEIPKEIENYANKIKRILKKLFEKKLSQDIILKISLPEHRDLLPKQDIISLRDVTRAIKQIMEDADILLRKLKKMYSLISELEKKKSSISKLVNDLNYISSNIERENLDATEDLRNLINIATELSDVEGRLIQNLAGSGELSIILEDVTKYHELAKNLLESEQYIISLIDELAEREKRIERTLKIIDEYLDKANRFYPLFEKKITKEEIDEYKKRVEELKLFFLEGRKFKIIDKDLSNIFERLDKLLSPYLNPIIRRFLDLLLQSKVTTFSLRELVRSISEETGKSESEVLDKIFEKLKELMLDGSVDILIQRKK